LPNASGPFSLLIELLFKEDKYIELTLHPVLADVLAQFLYTHVMTKKAKDTFLPLSYLIEKDSASGKVLTLDVLVK
jgi:hypothetical protein